MTDEEWDEFFVNLLRDILKDLQESYDSVKKYTLPEYKEICLDYEEKICLLSRVLSNISSIDDLEELSGEDLDSIYEDIYDYASNFVISTENKEQDMQTYSNIEEILYMFVDEDDEEYEDENE